MAITNTEKFSQSDEAPCSMEFPHTSVPMNTEALALHSDMAKELVVGGKDLELLAEVAAAKSLELTQSCSASISNSQQAHPEQSIAVDKTKLIKHVNLNLSTDSLTEDNVSDNSEGHVTREVNTDHSYQMKETRKATSSKYVTLSDNIQKTTEEEVGDSRVISPRIKLTMKDDLSEETTFTQSTSSIVIGSIGSMCSVSASSSTVTKTDATTDNDIKPSIPMDAETAVVSSEKKRGRPRNTIVKQKHPNLHMSIIPRNYPLLDHDYCYENYRNIVKAATELLQKVKESKEKKTASANTKPALSQSVNSEVKPRKKYRTKRIIAEEKEAERRADLARRAEDGNIEAKEELEKIRQQEECLSSEKTKRKRKLGDGDSIDELDAEVRKAKDPVKVHNSSFRDQYIYFGTKIYRSRRRHRAEEEDPYKIFWTTGQLPSHQLKNREEISHQHIDKVEEETSSSAENIAKTEAVEQRPGGLADSCGKVPAPSCNTMIQLSHNACATQEMTDVLDILGLSTSEIVQCDTDMASMDDSASREVPMTSTGSLSSAESIISSTVTSRHNSEDNYEDERVDSGFVESSLTLPDSNSEDDQNLDQLLLSMTAEQISEVIEAIEINTRLRATSDQSEVSSSLDENSPRKLSALAKAACDMSNISYDHIPVLQANKNTTATDTDIQLSQTSNISLNLDEADILSSEDKQLTLELFNELNSSPPKANIATQFTCQPAADVTAICDAEGSNSMTNANISSPMVVPVTMYWNTFPALLLDGIKYVRLIDISRQALPSKETGLLKKRAQTLGHEVLNCTDMQRNLLVRYAFACPSRSNLMVTAEAAEQVIASYMEKREIEELSKTLPTVQPAPGDAMVSVAPSKAPAEPVTLMPQVLVEHKPLQQSKSKTENDNVSKCSEVMPERSSRLRKVKSSYRRFLHQLGPHHASNKSDKGCDENSSDRGYHSDRSPDHTKSSNTGSANTKRKYTKRSTKRSLNESTEGITDVVLDVQSLSPTDNITPCSEAMSDDSFVQSPESQLMKGEDSYIRSAALSMFTGGSSLVHVRHIDLIPRRNGVRLSQDGDLHMDLFKSLHSACIQCCTCRQFFTIKSFMKHQHVDGKLVPVKLRQKLEARTVSVDSDSWSAFKQQQMYYESNRLPLKGLSTESKTSIPDNKSQMTVDDNSNVTEATTTTTKKRGRKPKQINREDIIDDDQCGIKRKLDVKSNCDGRKKRPHIA